MPLKGNVSTLPFRSTLKSRLTQYVQGVNAGQDRFNPDVLRNINNGGVIQKQLKFITSEKPSTLDVKEAKQVILLENTEAFVDGVESTSVFAYDPKTDETSSTYNGGFIFDANTGRMAFQPSMDNAQYNVNTGDVEMLGPPQKATNNDLGVIVGVSVVQPSTSDGIF